MSVMNRDRFHLCGEAWQWQPLTLVVWAW